MSRQYFLRHDLRYSVDKVEYRIVEFKVGVFPHVVGKVIGHLAARAFLQKIRLAEVLLAVDKELVAIPVHVVMERVVAVLLNSLLYEFFNGGFKPDKIQVLVELIGFDINRHLAGGFVLNVHNITAEIPRRRGYAALRRKQSIHRCYSENVHNKKKGDSSQNIQKQENSAENGFHRVVHFTAEKSEKRDHSRGYKQRPVTPVKQQRGKKHQHIGETDYARHERPPRIEKQQSRQQRYRRVYHGEFGFVHVGDVVEKHRVGEIAENDRIRRAKQAHRKDKPLVAQRFFQFFHYLEYSVLVEFFYSRRNDKADTAHDNENENDEQDSQQNVRAV